MDSIQWSCPPKMLLILHYGRDTMLQIVLAQYVVLAYSEDGERNFNID